MTMWNSVKFSRIKITMSIMIVFFLVVTLTYASGSNIVNNSSWITRSIRNIVSQKRSKTGRIEISCDVIERYSRSLRAHDIPRVSIQHQFGFPPDDPSRRIACILRASNCPIGLGTSFLDSVTRRMKRLHEVRISGIFLWSMELEATNRDNFWRFVFTIFKSYLRIWFKKYDYFWY